MNEQVIFFILALIFMIHNWEEYISFDQMPKPWVGKKILNRRNFLFATILLSLIVLLLSFPYFKKVHALVVSVLAINSLQHVVLSLWHRRVVPGTLSALFLMLPFCFLYFARLFREGEMDLCGLLQYLILAPIAMVISIMIALWLAHFIFSNKQKRS